ncbi:MAG: aminoacyl-tRNA hydrolase [Elusimicrobia bacterium]|nr:aminoacyl-tRNA hydrolase [Elusimicrobiota bacterium]
MAIRLVVGLGNPGKEYAQTRHNVGFLVLERLASRLDAGFVKKGQDGIVAEAHRDNGKLTLACPMTYMNHSGSFVRYLACYSNVEPQDVLVCFDDFALRLGRLRIRRGGSAGGHNGMQSIIDHLKSSDIPRLRVGIGDPSGRPTKDFVLSGFAPAERPVLKEAVDRAAEAVLEAVDRGVEAAMNRFNAEPAA